MADYGLPDLEIANKSNIGQSPIPKAQASVPEAKPVSVEGPQGGGSPQFDEDSLLKILDARANPRLNPQGGMVNGNPDQFSGVNAVGTPGQLAQASLGRNVNERLQIWSKLVGDKNAVIGPDNDIWIRKDDDKFHPADHGHTNFLQDFAKQTGAGIDLTAQAIGELAGLAGGTVVGGPGAGTAVGGMVGLAAGPSLGSYGREFLMKRLYGVTPDKEQLKRDMLLGGSLNLILGGMFGTAGRLADKAESVALQGPRERAIQLARAQEGAKQFMDTVGALPSKFGEEGIEAPLYDAGESVYGAVDQKRKNYNETIRQAKDKIISAAGPQKPDTSGLAMQVKDFLIKNGVEFDQNNMPKPFGNIPIYADEVNANQIGSVPKTAVSSPLGAEGGASVINDLSDDYKALSSGQMTTQNFMDKISQWQDKANFKRFDPRSDKLRRAWAQLQNAGVEARNNFVGQLFQSDPEGLSSIQKAYQDYSSTKDAVDMVMDQFGDKGAYEKGARSLLNSDNTQVLIGLKNLTADHPEVFKNLRGAYLSEKMSNFVNQDGLFDAPSFFKSLKGESRKTMQTLFTPEELGKLQRSAKIMGSIKTSDLTSFEQGQNIAEAIGDQIKLGADFDLSKPGSWLEFFKKKPTLATYLGNEGFPELAKRNSLEDASKLNEAARALKNWTLARRLPKDSSVLSDAIINSVPNPRGITQMRLRSNPHIAQGVENLTGLNVMSPTQPQGETGSEASAMNQLGPQ